MRHSEGFLIFIGILYGIAIGLFVFMFLGVAYISPLEEFKHDYKPLVDSLQDRCERKPNVAECVWTGEKFVPAAEKSNHD